MTQRKSNSDYRQCLFNLDQAFFALAGTSDEDARFRAALEDLIRQVAAAEMRGAPINVLSFPKRPVLR